MKRMNDPGRQYSLLEDLGIAAKEGGRELGHAVPETAVEVAGASQYMAADFVESTDPVRKMRKVKPGSYQDFKAMQIAQANDPDFYTKMERLQGKPGAAASLVNPLGSHPGLEDIPDSAGESLAKDLRARGMEKSDWVGDKRSARAEARAEKYPEYFDPELKMWDQPSFARATVGAAPSMPGMLVAVFAPVLGSALMTAQESMPNYVEMREKGFEPREAAGYTALHAVGTFALEKLPFDIKIPTTKLAKAIGGPAAVGLAVAAGAAKEAGTEWVQEGWQYATSHGFDGSMEEFLKETDHLQVLASAGLTGMGVGTFQEGIRFASERAVEKAAGAAGDGGVKPGMSRKEWMKDEDGIWKEVTVLTPDPALSAGPVDGVDSVDQVATKSNRRTSRPAEVVETGKFAASTPDGSMQVAGDLVDVPMSQIVTSFDARFDQDLQNRNRASVASEVQIDKIGRELDARRLLNDSPTTDAGPPVAVRRLNPETQETEYHIISGNGRTEAIKRAYAMGTADTYFGEFGGQFDFEEQPTRLRVIDEADFTPEKLREFVELSNRPQILERSAAEMAKADAELLTPDLLSALDPDKPLTLQGNPEFFAAFAGRAKDASLLKADGSVDDVAVRNRAAQAMVAALAAGHPQAREVITTLSERASELGLQGELNAISRAVPNLLKTGALKPEYDLRGAFGRAMNEMVQLAKTNAENRAQKRKEVSVQEWTGQLDLLAPKDSLSDELTMLLLSLDSRQLSDTLERYNELVSAVDTSTGDLFGVENTSALVLLQRAAAQVRNDVKLVKPEAAAADVADDAGDQVYDLDSVKIGGVDSRGRLFNGNRNDNEIRLRVKENKWVRVGHENNLKSVEGRDIKREQRTIDGKKEWFALIPSERWASVTEFEESTGKNFPYNKDTFFHKTDATFEKANPPTRAPDSESDFDSKYWYTDKGVYRQADHWGAFASVKWSLTGDLSEGVQTGFAPWSEFKTINPFRRSEVTPSPVSDARKKAGSSKARANVEPDPRDQYLKPFDGGLRQVFGSDAVNRVKGEFLNRPITNHKTGFQASVSGETLRKMLSGEVRNQSISPQAHMLALGNVDKLFERSTPVLVRGDREQNPNVRRMMHFRTTMTFDGNPVGVKLLVKEFADEKQGSRIYTIQAVEIEDPASWEYGDAQTGNSAVLAGSDNTLNRSTGDVKPSGNPSARADVGNVTGPGWPGGALQNAYRVDLAKPPESDADNPQGPLARWLGRPLQIGLDRVLEAVGAVQGDVVPEGWSETLSTVPVDVGVRVDMDPFALVGQVDTSDPNWILAWREGRAAFKAAPTPQELLKAVRAISMPVEQWEEVRNTLNPLVRDWDVHVLENGRIQLLRPGFTRMMMEGPELLRFAEWMGDGKIPHIMKKFRSKAWLGVFRYGDGKGDRIELRADIFQTGYPLNASC